MSSHKKLNNQDFILFFGGKSVLLVSNSCITFCIYIVYEEKNPLIYTLCQNC